MKKIFLILLLVSLFAACNKPEVNPNTSITSESISTNIESTIVGEWRTYKMVTDNTKDVDTFNFPFVHSKDTLEFVYQFKESGMFTVTAYENNMIDRYVEGTWQLISDNKFIKYTNVESPGRLSDTEKIQSFSNDVIVLRSTNFRGTVTLTTLIRN